MIAALAIFAGCSCNSSKKRISQTGEKVGEVVGEFFTGVGKGVDKDYQVKIQISTKLKEQGLSFGKISISNDTIGKDNLMSVYIIFEKEYHGALTARVLDVKKLEMGRFKLNLSGKSGQAAFYDFHFDKRTNIDSDSEIIIE